MTKVLIFAGTRKSGLIFTSDETRRGWAASDLHFKAWNVMYMGMGSRDRCIHAAAIHDVFGHSTHYSNDFGEIWTQAEKSPPSNDHPLTNDRLARQRRPVAMAGSLPGFVFR